MYKYYLLRKILFILNYVILVLAIAWSINPRFEFEPIIAIFASIISIITLFLSKKDYINGNENTNPIKTNTYSFPQTLLIVTLMLCFILKFTNELYLNSEYFLIRLISYYFLFSNFIFSVLFWFYIPASTPFVLDNIKKTNDKISKKEELNADLVLSFILGYVIAIYIFPNPNEKYFILGFSFTFYLNLLIIIFNIVGYKYITRPKRNILLCGMNFMYALALVFALFLIGHPISHKLLVSVEKPVEYIFKLL